MENIPRANLIKIQKHLGVAEYCCRHCGCVNSWETTLLKMVQFKNSKKKHYKPICSDCDMAGAWLLQTATERIWYKGSMTEIADFDSKLLAWMLKKDYFGIKAPRVRKAVIEMLEHRLFKPEEIKDIVMTGKETKAIEKLNDVNNDIRDYENDIKKMQKELVSDSDKWDYFEIKRCTNLIETKRRRIKSARKVLAKLLDEQDK